MKTSSFTVAVTFTATLAFAALTAFRSSDPANERPFLASINSHASTMRIAYNGQHAVSRLTRIQRTDEGAYMDVRIPVYEQGRLVRTLATDEENSSDGRIFSSFVYTQDQQRIARINYYRDEDVQGYDSLVYDNQGRISARYFYNRNAEGVFESHNYQAYTWNDAGNVSRMDNYGRMAAGGNFTLSSTVTYTYDQQPNPQKQVAGLCYITDILPAFLSANNILTEQLSHAGTDSRLTNTYTYTYNAADYPVSITARYGANGPQETTELRYQ
ncbi:hypothetical protein [Chitinophaga japonensis]|uniref:YD repeat-containing protein n=1 Tax=Chitinophaga japonensis TaxID=104662 RepID=A0A562SNB7_CHIJA|nr:hypothetical protein [Chitinophaga japonensis]TWI82678.1 YD repeat-containing protein [Chitinophaga japonensis]